MAEVTGGVKINRNGSRRNVNATFEKKKCGQSKVGPTSTGILRDGGKWSLESKRGDATLRKVTGGVKINWRGGRRNVDTAVDKKKGEKSKVEQTSTGILKGCKISLESKVGRAKWREGIGWVKNNGRRGRINVDLTKESRNVESQMKGWMNVEFWAAKEKVCKESGVRRVPGSNERVQN